MESRPGKGIAVDRIKLREKVDHCQSGAAAADNAWRLLSALPGSARVGPERRNRPPCQPAPPPCYLPRQRAQTENTPDTHTGFS